jgi:hypothetical protein
VYFRRQGGYMESDSVRVNFSKLCWTTLKIPLPGGTGECPLRLDPADAPGIIRIREIVLLGASGAEIWRADTANGFQGCKAGGSDFASIRDSCLSIEAATNDPQLFLDCPQTNQPVTMRITLYAGDS